MEIPYLAFSKQLVLVLFTVSFTLTAVAVWFSDLNRHGAAPFSDQEENRG